MLVLFAYAIAIGIMMIGPKVERINPARTTMDEGVRQSPCQRIVAANHEQRIAGLRRNADSKLPDWRVIFVFTPS